jgi:uncharacterized protein (DUF302 family)
VQSGKAFAILATMSRTLIFCLTLLVAASARGADEEIVRHALKANFEQAKENLVMAIEGRGLVVNNVSHVGDMLERTGRDLGSNAKLYGKAEVIEFCSATVSRQMMAANPHNIVFCPYSIAVYTLPGQDDHAWIAYRRLPQQLNGVQAAEELLAGIVREALQ